MNFISDFIEKYSTYILLLMTFISFSYAIYADWRITKINAFFDEERKRNFQFESSHKLERERLDAEKKRLEIIKQELVQKVNHLKNEQDKFNEERRKWSIKIDLGEEH